MNNTQSTLLAVGLAVLLLVGTGSVLAQQETIDVQGEPDFEVYLPDNIVGPGEETDLTVQLDNNGELEDGQETNRELVTTARNVVVELDSDDAPIDVTTRRQAVGTISEDEPRDVSFGIEVPDDAEPGTYEVDVDVEYRYTKRVTDTASRTAQEEKSTDESFTVKVKVDDGPRFRVENVSSSLRVGEEGELTGTVVNVGEQDATDAEVQFPTDAESLFPLETAVAVGDVPAGESAEFSIPIEVGTEAEAVPKRFDLPVSFSDENGIRQTDDDPSLLADIAPERDTFGVDPVNRTITAGSATSFEVTFTNNREETLTDIEPKLFTDSPFSSSSDEGFIESLDPGESETVRFDLSAEGSATPKTYPVTLDVRYQDAGGESRITDSYRLPVEVLEPEESGGLGSLGSIALVVVSLLAVGGGYVWYRGQ